MSADLEIPDEGGPPEDEPFRGWMVTVEVCILTPEGEVATGEDKCEYIECEFDHAPTTEEIGECALEETNDWINMFLYGGRFQSRFGNNPTITLGNIIYQRI